MKRPSATRRGYDQAHRKLRERWKPIVESGRAICCRCGHRIDPRAAWCLDHADTPNSHRRNGGDYRGVSCLPCNTAARNRAYARRLAQLEGRAARETPRAAREFFGIA